MKCSEHHAANPGCLCTRDEWHLLIHFGWQSLSCCSVLIMKTKWQDLIWALKMREATQQLRSSIYLWKSSHLDFQGSVCNRKHLPVLVIFKGLSQPKWFCDLSRATALSTAIRVQGQSAFNLPQCDMPPSWGILLIKLAAFCDKLDFHLFWPYPYIFSLKRDDSASSAPSCLPALRDSSVRD